MKKRKQRLQSDRAKTIKMIVRTSTPIFRKAIQKDARKLNTKSQSIIQLAATKLFKLIISNFNQ